MFICPEPQDLLIVGPGRRKGFEYLLLLKMANYHRLGTRRWIRGLTPQLGVQILQASRRTP